MELELNGEGAETNISANMNPTYSIAGLQDDYEPQFHNYAPAKDTLFFAEFPTLEAALFSSYIPKDTFIEVTEGLTSSQINALGKTPVAIHYFQSDENFYYPGSNTFLKANQISESTIQAFHSSLYGQLENYPGLALEEADYGIDMQRVVGENGVTVAYFGYINSDIYVISIGDPDFEENYQNPLSEDKSFKEAMQKVGGANLEFIYLRFENIAQLGNELVGAENMDEINSTMMNIASKLDYYVQATNYDDNLVRTEGQLQLK